METSGARGHLRTARGSKPFVVTSGTLMVAFLAPGRTGTEEDALRERGHPTRGR
jgi:hypothetical protein